MSGNVTKPALTLKFDRFQLATVYRPSDVDRSSDASTKECSPIPFIVHPPHFRARERIRYQEGGRGRGRGREGEEEG